MNSIPTHTQSKLDGRGLTYSYCSNVITYHTITYHKKIKLKVNFRSLVSIVFHYLCSLVGFLHFNF
jgi:hypothetical protein